MVAINLTDNEFGFFVYTLVVINIPRNSGVGFVHCRRSHCNFMYNIPWFSKQFCFTVPGECLSRKNLTHEYCEMQFERNK